MTSIILIVAFGCMVWAGAMTVLYSVAVKDLSAAKSALIDQERRFTDSETLDRYYQSKISSLVGRLRTAAPWMLRADDDTN